MPPTPESSPAPRGSIADRTVDAVLRGLIWVAMRVPYRARVRGFGWLVAHVIGPLAGYRRRAEANLALIRPDLGVLDRRRMATAVCNNVGRTMIENYSAPDLAATVADLPIHGAGLAAIEQAQAGGRPVLLVTGHIGNHEAPRHALHARGIEVGGLYKAMRNPYFNAHYVETMEEVSGPIFEQGLGGTKGFVQHLRRGGALVLLFDVHYGRGTPIEFLGRPALTSLSAAELALRFDALLVPFFGIRRPDGLSFDIHVEAPVPHSTAPEMMREVTRRLEARIHDHPEQWFWYHRRWRKTIRSRQAG